MIAAIDQVTDEKLARYVAEFQRSEAELERSGPRWLHDTRRAALESFIELGFPTARNEDWKFTSIAALTAIPFERAAGRADGISHLPQDLLERHLGRYVDFRRHAFVALNTAFLTDVSFVYVPAGAAVKEPIVVTHTGAHGVAHPRNLIVVEPGSQVALIETYAGNGGQYFTNAVTEIIVGEGAVVDHYKLQVESVEAFHIATIQVELGRGSSLRSHSLSFGGRLARTEINAVLDEGAECTLNGLYIVSGNQHVDNRTSIDHAKPHGASHELYKGILDGHSSAVFNGRIIVRPDAQKTDAKQTNKNLVLSENSTINTKPELQIHADDVRCTHGATIGQLDRDAAFYLQSRGIGREEAREMLIAAFAREIVDGIKVDSLRNRVEGFVDNAIGRH